MTENNQTAKYLYIIVWDNVGRRMPTIHWIALRLGVAEADFERFMREEGFPATGSLATRAYWVVEQSLFKETIGSGRSAAPDVEPEEAGAENAASSRLEGLPIDLATFGNRTAVSSLIEVGRWSHLQPDTNA
jgi:hypothetical protein